MAAIMAKISAFFLSIIYFLGSYGIGTNPGVTIHVTDANNEPVANVVVYYVDDEHPEWELYTIIPIGNTDENGNLTWDKQHYDEQTLHIYNSEFDEDPMWSTRYDITVSRTQNETIEVNLDFVYGE